MSNYSSNLNDGQWELIKDFLPKTKSGGYDRKHSRREMLNAIFYINKTGCQWLSTRGFPTMECRLQLL